MQTVDSHVATSREIKKAKKSNPKFCDICVKGANCTIIIELKRSPKEFPNYSLTGLLQLQNYMPLLKNSKTQCHILFDLFGKNNLKASCAYGMAYKIGNKVTPIMLELKNFDQANSTLIFKPINLDKTLEKIIETESQNT